MLPSRPVKLRNFILAASCCVAAIFFALCFILARAEFERSARAQAETAAAAMARSTFAAMYELMSTGWNHTQVESFVKSVRSAGDAEQQIQIYRAPAVIARYGEISQPPMDAALEGTIRSGSPGHLATPTGQRYIFPLVAEQKCLTCHSNANVGTVLGIIEVTRDLQGFLTEANRKMAFMLAGLTALAMVAALLVVLWVNRRIEGAISRVESSVASINAVSDLRSISVSSQQSGFVELDRILGSLGELAGKLHDIAVDKDILKFEISLLERFVITSEVVRDWQQYLALLLEEINQVLTTHMLFSIFEIEEEIFDLEIFWRYPPSKPCRELTDQHILKTLREHHRFGDLATINIIHHVCKPDAPAVDLSSEEITVRVKSFFVETPKIGGIVGIGVHAHEVDETRYLVMDSVLSTLLNVIGSVKAIYKYTRDLEYYATRDALTNLYNQRVFWEMLSFEEERAQRHGQPYGLLIIDIDNFKTINDSYGHSVGDRLLQALVATLRQQLRGTDILARYGGDEFVVILPETDFNGAVEIANRILVSARTMDPIMADGTPLRATVSVGMAVYPDHGDNSKDIFLFADNLLYKAKGEGKNRVSVPSEEDAAQVFRDISQRSMMVLNAIENREIIPYFQPILDIKERRVIGHECLSRLPFGQEVLRAEMFIELAEKLGVIHRLDLIVIERALEDLAGRHYDGLIFFNLSPRALVLKEFSHNLMEIVERTGVAPKQIVFEITERDTIRNLDVLEKFVFDLKAHGFGLALDDFGSGFSSFHYLRRFPIDFLKLEGDFVSRIQHDPKDRAFVQCMRNLAADLGIRVIAEFVESKDVLDALAAMEVDLAQGYYIGRPSSDVPPIGPWQAPQEPN